VSAEERRIIIVREDRPFWRTRYHWTVERMDGGPELDGEGRSYAHGAALREAASRCSGIGPYARTEAIVVSKWKLATPRPKRPSPLASELLAAQPETTREEP
jgi:hypothetical protein